MARGKFGRDVELWTQLTDQTATLDDDVPMTRCGRLPLGLGAAAGQRTSPRPPVPRSRNPPGNEVPWRWSWLNVWQMLDIMSKALQDRPLPWADVWVTGVIDGYIEEVLQEAIRVVEECVDTRGLTCFLQKSELFLLRPKRGGKEKSNIELFAQGHRIPKVEIIRVLGPRIQADGKNREVIQALGGTAYQVARLIVSISNRNYGMKEGNLMCLVQAFVRSRLA
ncbi:hypothetical protein HPB47_019096 [Ixodes persulcatus]|uniref:Uncharacterized protein n=1 Tax=Ixodes persulcatus TaxID=34615 RepID=A0AC60QJX5_IXOPE|nr:hypothetical protein HPB47_019096 [Ixodes persulcatus]